MEIITRSLKLKVERYPGYKADERPLRFTSLARDGRTYEVTETLDQWYGEEYQCFKAGSASLFLKAAADHPIGIALEETMVI